MDFDEMFEFLDGAVYTQVCRHLKDVEKCVFLGTWLGQTYDEIALASQNRYTASYLKQDIGPKLWKLVSEVLGEEVSKTNFRAALERRILATKDIPTQNLRDVG